MKLGERSLRTSSNNSNKNSKNLEDVAKKVKRGLKPSGSKPSANPYQEAVRTAKY